MKKLLVVLAIALVALTVSQPAFAWGDYPYYRYNRPNVGARIAGAAIGTALGVIAGTVLMGSMPQPYGYGYQAPVYSAPVYPQPYGYPSYGYGLAPTGQNPNFPPPGAAYCAPGTPGCRLYVQPGNVEVWLPY